MILIIASINRWAQGQPSYLTVVTVLSDQQPLPAIISAS
jgi:hypothetical protein